MLNAKPEDIIALIAAFEKSASQEMRVSMPGFELQLAKTANGLLRKGGFRQDGPATIDPKPAASSLDVTKPASGVSGVPSPQRSKTEKVPNAPAGHAFVRAANLGTFYRSPQPGAPAYVEIGSRVAADTEVCLIEVMKLFTPLRAGIAGTVRETLVQDGQLVEFDQPLFLVQLDS